MGADIHVTLGYVKKDSLALPKPQERLESQTSGNMLQIRGTYLSVGDITLHRMDDDYEPDRNYRLFAWLSNVRGSIRPFSGSSKENEEWQTKTRGLFIALAEHEGLDTWDYRDRVSSGDHSFNFFTVAELVFFDYDQVYDMDPRDLGTDEFPLLAAEYENVEYDVDVWIANPWQQTFKDIFHWEHREKIGNWFCFLEYLKTHNVDFIIVGFDN